MSNRNYLSRQRRRRQQQRRRVILFGACGIVLVAVIASIVIAGGRKPAKPETRVSATTAPTPSPTVTVKPTATPVPEAEATESAGDLNAIWRASDSEKVTTVPTAAPTAAAKTQAASDNRQYIPVSSDGLVPVFTKSDTDEKIIAITVDDCFQGQNMRNIFESAKAVGGKLTFFPIGENAIRDTQAQVLRDAFAAGFEIENHTYTHNGLYRCTDEELAQEICMQAQALNYVLNVDYTCHFLRPKGGDARADQRMRRYIAQLGYYGVAHWSYSGSGASVAKLKESLQPGRIYLFHTTDKDWAKLKEFIPYAASQGYKLVTLNEMFGYPDNETKPLTEAVTYDPNNYIPLEPFEYQYVTLKQGMYLYDVKRLQDRLIELGYLADGADGCYGKGTAAAVSAFQRAAGLQEDGVAGPQTQELLYSDSAPKRMK